MATVVVEVVVPEQAALSSGLVAFHLADNQAENNRVRLVAVAFAADSNSAVVRNCFGNWEAPDTEVVVVYYLNKTDLT